MELDQQPLGFFRPEFSWRTYLTSDKHTVSYHSTNSPPMTAPAEIWSSHSQSAFATVDAPLQLHHKFDLLLATKLQGTELQLGKALFSQHVALCNIHRSNETLQLFLLLKQKWSFFHLLK